jgi:hypothetical protein
VELCANDISAARNSSQVRKASSSSTLFLRRRTLDFTDELRRDIETTMSDDGDLFSVSRWAIIGEQSTQTQPIPGG